jgi:tetratricopeptide (TPR) repeat protein
MGSSLEKEAKNVNKMADKKFKEKDYVEAIKLYKESIRLMKMAGNEKQAGKYEKELDEALAKRAKEINEEGDEFFDKKEYKKAISIYKDAVSLLKKAGTKWLKKYGNEFYKELHKCKKEYVKDVLQDQAEELVKQKKLEEAAEHYHKMLGLISTEVDAKLRNKLEKALNSVYEDWGEEMNEKGDKLYKDDRFEDAIKAYSRAVKLIRRSGNEKRLKNYQKELIKAFKEHAEEINKLGDRLFKEKDYQKAADLYAQSVRIAKSSNDQKLIDKFTEEMEKAFEKLAKEINEDADELYKNKKFPAAAKLYKRSLNIAKEYNQPKLASKFREEYEEALEKWAKEENSLGDEAREAKNWDVAIKHYQDAVALILKTDNEGRIKNYTKEYRKTCLKAAEDINSDADKLYDGGQYKEAYKLYKKSVKLAEMAEDEKRARKYAKERNKCLEKMQY